jgi:phage terminase large subunit GpA-like protein
MDTTITIERLHERTHQLHAYCPVCDRWKLLNLDDMLARWHGLEQPPTEVQCSDCGHFGLLRVRTRLARRVQPEPAILANSSLAG